MNKLLFLLTFLLFPFLSFSQIQSGEIIYKVKEVHHTKDYGEVNKDNVQVHGLLKEHYRKMSLGLPFLQFKLQFNSNEATYESIETMDIDFNNNLEIALLASRGNGKYYVNKEQNIQLHQLKENDKDWLIKAVLDTIDWSIQNEIKEIEGFKVQKATATIPLNHVKLGEVTAWFAPDIPFPFGPIGIYGLPGLILEYEINGIAHYATEIKFYDQDLKIKRPTKGEEITEKEYIRYLMKSLKEYFEANR